MNFPAGFRQKMGLLKWLLPLGLILIVIAYELGPSLWIYDNLGFNTHLIFEILLFATVGPLFAYIALELLHRWIDEKETAETQAYLLDKAREKELAVRQISDDTLQVLFASSLLMTAIRSRGKMSPSMTAQIEKTEKALDESIDRLRGHLLEQ